MFLALLAIAHTTTTGADHTDLTISPDRPGFADSTAVVPPGHVQVELGVRSDFDDDALVLTAPSILVRAGFHELVELRVVAPDGQVSLPSGGDPRLGIGDITLGLKVAGESGIFSASAVPYLTLPTGSPELSSGRVEGGAGFNFQLSFTESFAVGWNLIGAFVDNGGLDRVVAVAAGLSAGLQITGAFGVFVEAYATKIEEEEYRPSVAGGATYLITPQVQIDLSGGTGVTGDSESPYVIAGLAALL